MASGQETGCPQLKDLTCSICLSIFTDPRLLPCHHSFCSSCIEDVANSNGGKTFPCPTCRQSANMPSNGVAGFQSNFYRTNTLHIITGVKLYCSTHPREELDMYCTECKVPACYKCARTKHTEPSRNHVMEDLLEAAKKAKEQLKWGHKYRLEDAVMKLQKTVAATEQEKQDIQTKKAILENNITNRHAVIIAAANKARDDALEELTKTADTLEAKLNTDLAGEKRDLAAVEKLQRNVEDVISRDVHCKVVEVAKEMAEGSGSVNRIKTLTSHDRSTVLRPVLRSLNTVESATESTKDYIGKLYRQDFKSESTSATIESSRIPKDLGAEVFSMAITDDGSLTMSYTWKNHSTTASSEKFDSHGKQTATYAIQGQVSYVSRGNYCSLYRQTPGKFITQGKSHGYSLHNEMKGTGNIYKNTVVQEEPYQSRADHVFSIKCGPHRAFDASPDGQLFAVLEEPSEKGQSGTVKLYIRPAVATSTSVPLHPVPTDYSSPISHFQPTDVCFLNDSKLLIADEGNDAIQVVTVGAGLSFHSYLAIGNPLLVQPKAMTIDNSGALWVACRDRNIFIFRNIKCSDPFGFLTLHNTSGKRMRAFLLGLNRLMNVKH